MDLKERIEDFKVYANKLMESDFDLTLREALEFIKNQQEIIEEAKKIIKYNNLIKDKEGDPFYYKSYMSDFIEVFEKNINKIEQNND